MGLSLIPGRIVAQLRSWVGAMVRRERLEAEMESELACHLDQLTADLIRRGYSAEEAARRARISLGAAPVLMERMRASLGLRWWDELGADVRYGARMLCKSPGFTAVAALSLALAIGANTTIFSVAKQILYNRLNVPHAEDLRLLAWTGTEAHVAVHHVWGDWDPQPDGRVASTAFSFPAYQHLRSQTHVLEDVFAFKRMGMIATVREGARKVRTEMVSGNYFAALDLGFQLGRPIEAADDAVPGRGAVAVISDEFWDRVFDRSPAVLGQTVNLNNVAFTIVGVAPKGFTGAKDVQLPADFFIPLSMQPLVAPRRGNASLFTDAGTWWVNVMGRAKPGVGLKTAQTELDGELAAFVRGSMPVRPKDDLPRLDLRDGSRGLFEERREFARPMAVLLTLVGFVLLLACANVANLMLARGTQRTREMGVRLALGAGRARILRQMLVESLMLAGLGGLGGLIAGYLGRNAIPKMLEVPWENTGIQIHFDWTVFAFTAGVTLTTGLLFGLAPALTAARAEVANGLKEYNQTTTRRRRGLSGKALVGFQIALSTLLVIGAGLFLRTLAGLSSVPLGFRPDHLLLAEIDPPAGRYPAGKDIALHQSVEQAFAAVPGVLSVAPAQDVYINEDRSATDFLPVGEAYSPNQSQEENYNVVGNRFFETLGIPIVAGRGFGGQDTSSSPKVAVINQRLARSRFPGQDPVGKRFVIDPHDSDGGGGVLASNSIEIVGVCGDTRYMTLRDEPPAQFFLPFVQQTSVGGMVYEIRTSVSPDSVLGALRGIIHHLDPDLALVNVRTQDEQIESTLVRERLFTTLTSGFGLLALALACVGIYGIMAYSVANRRNEIGIRMALGAQPGQVRGMILRESTWLAGVGIVVGVVAALGLTRLVKSMLYGIKPYDPATMAGGVLILLVVALAASWIPARRAARVQPMDALRHE